MHIRIGARVDATDGRVGEISRVVVESPRRSVTHIVVRDGRFFGVERMVPVEDVVDATPERVSLAVSHAQFGLLTPFVRSVMHERDTPNTFFGQVAAKEVLLDQHDVSEDEVVFKGGERVEATDGAIGHADAVVADRSTGHITHIVLHEGHLWRTHTVTIPVDQIDYAARQVIYLKLDKQQVGELAKAPEVAHSD